MKKSFLLTLALSLPALATDMPPAIPDGPVSYDSVSYEDPLAGADYGFADATTPAPAMAAAPAPITAASSSDQKAYININAFSTNYQVRGMGVTDYMSSNGYSSIDGSFIVGNRNLFNKGVYQRISGEAGVIWGAASGSVPFIKNQAAAKKYFYSSPDLFSHYLITSSSSNFSLPRVPENLPFIPASGSLKVSL